jgi:TBC1 domain family member 20
VIQRKEELFEIPPDEPEMLHSVLCKLPKPLNLELLIQKTTALFDKYPPERLSSWRHISPNSVLKTSRHPIQMSMQTLDDGHYYFVKQAEELRREELRKMVLGTMWKYRRPAGAVGMTVMVGLLAFWMRRSGSGGGGHGLDGVLGVFKRFF